MPPAIPIATYRLQLTADFDFEAAAGVVPYLKALGITHLYASPFMKARQGSTHGYDIVDHTKLNPELGGEAGFARLSAALKQHDLGLILDFVPNHVGVHFADNPWWLDVLEWGPASPNAVSFDIDWEQLPYRARGGVLLPIIGSSYRQALERGKIELRYDPTEGSFSAWYFEHRLPIGPERYSEILRTIVKEAGAADSAAGKGILALASRHRGLRHPNRKEAPGFKAELKSIPGGAEIIARGCPPIAPARTDRRRRWRCIICSSASTTGSVIGGWLPATSTIVASSTSIRSRGYGSRMPAPSRPFTAWSGD
jgi:(1->4)-alpha-D-glucan 1-alpha-D-glucosylmutase